MSVWPFRVGDNSRTTRRWNAISTTSSRHHSSSTIATTSKLYASIIEIEIYSTIPIKTCFGAHIFHHDLTRCPRHARSPILILCTSSVKERKAVRSTPVRPQRPPTRSSVAWRRQPNSPRPSRPNIQKASRNITQACSKMGDETVHEQCERR